MALISDLVGVVINIGSTLFIGQNYSAMAILHMASPAANARTYQVVSQADAVAQIGISTADPLYTALGAAFSQSPRVQYVYVVSNYATDASAGTSLDAGLAALAAAGGFYGVCVAARDIPTIHAVMTWAQTNHKLFGFSTAEADAINPATTDDLLSYNTAQNNQYCFGFTDPSAATNYLDVAAMSKCFSYVPGSENWSLQQLYGVTTSVLTEGARTAVLAKNGSTFQAYGNVSCTFGGKTGSGDWIDTIRFRDWLLNQIQVEVADNLTGPAKVPFTDKGILTIKAGVGAALDQGVTNGGISPPSIDPVTGNLIPSYTISAPKRFSVPTSQAQSRILNGITFSAELANAINVVNVTGTLLYGAAS